MLWVIHAKTGTEQFNLVAQRYIHRAWAATDNITKRITLCRAFVCLHERKGWILKGALCLWLNYNAITIISSHTRRRLFARTLQLARIWFLCSTEPLLLILKCLPFPTYTYAHMYTIYAHPHTRIYYVYLLFIFSRYFQSPEKRAILLCGNNQLQLQSCYLG